MPTPLTGASIYVALVFGLFLTAWTATLLMQRCWHESAVYIAAGATGLVLFLPYAFSLRGPALVGPTIQFWIRPFYPVDGLFRGQHITSGWILDIANALVLPLNYFLELGFFLVAAVLWWNRHRASGQRLTRAESATALMIGTSVLVCTFMRSSVIGNNDLGWRGFLFAQFGLLLWGVDIVSDWRVTGRGQRVFLAVLLILGAAGSAYELGINRFYPLLADRGTVAPLTWLGPDRQAGSRIYARREAGEWATASTSQDAIVQFDPHVAPARIRRRSASLVMTSSAALPCSAAC